MENILNKFKVHLCGGEGINWALDHDLIHVRRIAADFADFVPLEKAEIVHSVWWRGLSKTSKVDLANKAVIASIANDPHNLVSQPAFFEAAPKISLWLAEYHQALYEMSQFGYPCALFPDPIDLLLFKAEKVRENKILDLKMKIGIDKGTYLIGNFHRDSDGADLSKPKKQKGADLFLEIVTAIHETGRKIHILLAGPRRHWLKNKLREREIPFTFIGTEMEEDDRKVNTLPQTTIKELMIGLDLYLITSRWEGAPNATHETAAMEVPVLSTSVGQSPDILPTALIYHDMIEGIHKVIKDIDQKWIKDWMPAAKDFISKRHSDEALGKRLFNLYEMALRLPKVKAEIKINNRSFFQIQLKKKIKKDKKIIAWVNDSGVEWIYIREKLHKKGWYFDNDKESDISVHIVEQGREKDYIAKSKSRSKSKKIIHRIVDSVGELDQFVIDFNKNYADVTIFESAFGLVRLGKDFKKGIWIPVAQNINDNNKSYSEVNCFQSPIELIYEKSNLSQEWMKELQNLSEKKEIKHRTFGISSGIANYQKTIFLCSDIRKISRIALKEISRYGLITCYNHGWNGVSSIGFNSIQIDNLKDGFSKLKKSLIYCEKLNRMNWQEDHNSIISNWIKIISHCVEEISNMEHMHL